MATRDQIETIEHRRIDDTAREMMRAGLQLTWAQADEIGDAGAQWLRDRLGLVHEKDDRGVTYRPADDWTCPKCGQLGDRHTFVGQQPESNGGPYACPHGTPVD